jgi:hypothetical protein
MGQISMATRDELVVALAGRYAATNRKERGRILDEFAAVSGLHRKHAMRLLRAGSWVAGQVPEGQLCANADVDGHRDGLDGMRAAAGAGAEAADRGIE